MTGYLELSKKELLRRSRKLSRLLNPCRICPRECGVNRKKGGLLGFCKMGNRVYVSGIHPHFGEEKVLVGKNGSGTIFFTSCNLACVYCQNWEISQERAGERITIEKLGEEMVGLQNMGCSNINLVSPTIWVSQIIKAVIKAKGMGLVLPLVYNSGGYDRVETLKLLEGVVDIYMPDVKYGDDRAGGKYSQVDDYWQVVKKAVREMHRQVGNLRVLEEGVAEKGLLVRHLVLPNGLAGSKKVVRFLAEISKNTYLNIMDQYYPANKAYLFSKLNRRITGEEYKKAVKAAKKAGLKRFD